MTHNVKFKVSISNGETLHEGKGFLSFIDGKPSPWQRLLEYLKKENLTITSLSLYTDTGATFNLPALGRNPKFHVFQSAPKPLSYRFFHILARDVDSSKHDHFVVIQASYKNYSLQLWVDEIRPKNSWVLVK